MKFSGLFRKQTETPEISESQFKDDYKKLWQKTNSEILTANKARKISNNKFKFTYLDKNILSIILNSVKESSERHNLSTSGIIDGVSLSQEEINYCNEYLNNAGYQNVILKNNNNPKYIEFYLNW